MPWYEFECQDCRQAFDKRRPFARSGEAAACPHCGSLRTYKILANVAVISSGGRSAAASGESIPVPFSSGGCGCGGACACGA